MNKNSRRYFIWETAKAALPQLCHPRMSPTQVSHAIDEAILIGQKFANKFEQWHGLIEESRND